MRNHVIMLLLAGGPCLAQTTWTVNASGGAQFTTIQAAVQAASDGDTILVQPAGVYVLNFTLTKGVSILGSATVLTYAVGYLQVFGLAANLKVAIANFACPLGQWFHVDVIGCAGSVHCDGLQLTGYCPCPYPSAVAMTIASSALVTVHRTQLSGGIVATNSAVAVSESTLYGKSATGLYDPYRTPAVVATACRIALTSCTVQGGYGGAHNIGATGMTCGYTLVTAARTNFIGGNGGHGVGNSIDLTSTSYLEHDPACGFTGIVQAGPGALTQVEMCRVAGGAAGPGSTALFTLTGPAGDVAALFAAFPAPPWTLPFGVAWLDPSIILILQVGILPLPAASFPIPAVARHGTPLSVQPALLHLGVTTLGPPLTTIVK